MPRCNFKLAKQPFFLIENVLSFNSRVLAICLRQFCIPNEPRANRVLLPLATTDGHKVVEEQLASSTAAPITFQSYRISHMFYVATLCSRRTAVR
ncbi:hypothetical protein L596_001217 [Steinernema carpocapsae]|uniref:Uncharacterized protein n=1 Tax=Steinernema carpocapsae TaxID=34508 RepID=A0A4V6I7C3_STECR|nr:hypothetical protein L596_001217 [Steinernema carpocapsae]